MASTKVMDTKERDEFFNTQWSKALGMYIGLSTSMPDKGWDIADQKLIVQGLGMLIGIINDMREIDINQRAEIESLKACLQMKEK